MKCLIAADLGEVIVSVITMPFVILFNFLTGKTNLFTFYGRLQVEDGFYYLLVIMIMAVFYHLTAPVLELFRAYHMRHKKLVSTVMIFYIGGLQLMALDDAQNTGMIISFFF